MASLHRHENWDKIHERVANVIDAVTKEEPLAFYVSKGMSDTTLELADLFGGYLAKRFTTQLRSENLSTTVLVS